MNSFQQEMRAVYTANQFDTEQHAERVEFIPSNGDRSRSITVTIRKRQRAQENQVTQDNREEFAVLIGRDVSDPTIGGVASLRQNDQLIRSLEIDSTGSALTFTGEILEESVSFIRAVFVRVKRVAQGRGGAA